MKNKIYIKFDIICAIIGVFIILPIIIPTFRILLNRRLMFFVSAAIIGVGLYFIINELNESSDFITFEQEHKKFIYFGTTLTTAGILSVIYLIHLNNLSPLIKVTAQPPSFGNLTPHIVT